MKNLGNNIFVMCSLMLSVANAQADIENIMQLRQTVAQFLTAEYDKTEASKVEIKVGGLDPRLHLMKCDQTLALKLQDSSGNGGNINVQVSCRSSFSWTILVPAQAIIYRPMAVASRNLQRGELISETDISTDTLNMSLYRQGYTHNPSDIIGKELKYPVLKGDAFRSSVLDAPLAIKRGEEVSVEALIGSIRVVTTGTAISDGRLGQQVRIKNTQSARILSAKVVGPGKAQSIL